MKKVITLAVLIAMMFVMVNSLTLLPTVQAQSLSQLVNPTFVPVSLIEDMSLYIGPAPVQQLALPGQPGFINFNNTKFEVGDSIYAFSIFDEAKVDSNGYIWQDQFRFAKNAVVTGFREDGMVLIRLNDDEHDLSVIYECPQQSAVIYPRAQ